MRDENAGGIAPCCDLVDLLLDLLTEAGVLARMAGLVFAEEPYLD